MALVELDGERGPVFVEASLVTHIAPRGDATTVVSIGDFVYYIRGRPGSVAARVAAGLDSGPAQRVSSLRDYFAANALAGLLAHGVGPAFIEVGCDAYAYADAMMEAREAKEAPPAPDATT